MLDDGAVEEDGGHRADAESRKRERPLTAEPLANA